MLARIDGWLLQGEVRLGPVLSALLVSVVLALLAVAYVGLGSFPLFNGAEYADLSYAPFDTASPSRFRYRFLAPMLGWLTGLHGDRFMVVPWIFVPLFIAAVFRWARREGSPPTLALLVAACIAFSCCVLIPLIAPGYTDPVTFFFITIAFMHVRSAVMSALCLIMAITSHELSAVLLPAYLWYGASAQGPWTWVRRRTALIAVFAIPYLVFRWWVATHDALALSTGFYFSRQNLLDCLGHITPLALLGVLAAFRAAWLLPIIAFAGALAAKRSAQAWWYVVIIACVTLPLIVAYDTTRIACFAFPVLVVAARDVLRSKGNLFTVRVLCVLFVVDLLIPPFMVASGRSVLMQEVWEGGSPRIIDADTTVEPAPRQMH